MKKTTREWVKKAEADYRAAQRLAGAKPPLHDQTCFHCQQGAEKYLKALLEELGLAIPYTHVLLYLLGLLLPHYPSLRSLRRALAFLTRFASGARYPGYNATKRQSVAALCGVGKIRTAARALLGLRRLGP
jgi:HEPN domain-containing protein